LSFWTQALPYAQKAHAQTNVLVSVIMAQWADENGYHWPPPGNNPGNVGNTEHGGMVNYATITEGVDAYIHTMNLGYYTAVRNAVGYVDQSHALGESPWAAAHYEGAGPPPGQDLIKIIETNNLTQYDGATPPAPTPSPPQPQGEPMIAPTPSGNGYWLCSAQGAIITRGDAQYLGGPNTSQTATGWDGPPNLPAGQTIVSLAAHPTQQGYWAESSGGLIYSYGASQWHGNVS
jgi:hypothetical protein